MGQNTRGIPQLFVGETQERFANRVRQSQSLREIVSNLLAANDEPETLTLFLSACCGEFSDLWNLGRWAPKGLKDDFVVGVSQRCRDLARDVFLLCDTDIDNPIDFLQRKDFSECGTKACCRSEQEEAYFSQQERFERLEAESLWDLPVMLGGMASAIESWWGLRGKRSQHGSVHIEYLQAHFHAYGAVMMTHFTYADMEKVLEAARDALKGAIVPTASSLKTIIAGFKRNKGRRYAGMIESVSRYIKMKNAALSTGREWNTTYVRAANYVNSALPMMEVAAPLHPDRRKRRGAAKG